MPELHEVSPNKDRTSGPGGSNPADIGANMPAPVTEMDWGPAGTGVGVSGTGGMHDPGSGADRPLPHPHEGGPTHRASSYDTTRTTGGLIQHPNPQNLVHANATGGTGSPQGNKQGLENPGEGEREGMVGAGQGNAMMGGGQDQSPLVDPSSGDESRDQSQFSAT